MDWATLNREIIDEFRSNDGKVARFGDLPVVILHTIGAKTGQVREVPLIVVVDRDEMRLFGTNAGSDRHPVWVHNLRAHPQISVEMGTERFEAETVERVGDDAEALRQEQARTSKPFAAYLESAAPRLVPVFSIRRR